MIHSQNAWKSLEIVYEHQLIFEHEEQDPFQGSQFFNLKRQADIVASNFTNKNIIYFHLL